MADRLGSRERAARATYIEMEYVQGQSLNKVLKPGVPMPLEWVARILAQLCAVLQVAHEQGIVHRHLKPSNLMLLEGQPPGQEHLKVFEFENAAILETEASGRNFRTDMGTVGYASPEQISGGKVDGRSDLYSVGIILYEMLTGYRPFGGRTNKLIYDHLYTPPPKFAEKNPNANVPPQVEQVVLCCLTKNPVERYQSARELAEAFFRALPLAPDSQPRRTVLDEDVQFTVYRPKTVQPDHWYSMLAFAHLAERRPGAPKDEPDPIEQVRRQAALILGQQADEYRDTTTDSRQAIPREGEITFLPDIPGIKFNPERRVFCWFEDVHREEFRLQASPELDGRIARGRLSVYLGMILLAEVDLAIRVDRNQTRPPHSEPAQESRARPYRKIFASYSHKDVEIVRQFEHLVRSLGDRYLRDVVDLRAGEKWEEQLLRLIEKADVFQLFWSTNSMRSPFVRQEWEHALVLDRSNFIRPTYWEIPMPESSDPPLPPESLRRLHFHWLAYKTFATPAATGSPGPRNSWDIEPSPVGTTRALWMGPHLIISVALVFLIFLLVPLLTLRQGRKDGLEPPRPTHVPQTTDVKVQFATVPPAGPGPESRGDISGHVLGLPNPARYKVVLYSHTDQWYVQPTLVQPLTDIAQDGRWSNWTHLGDRFAALVVEPSFRPPSIAEALPATGGEVLAVAIVPAKSK